MNEQGIYYNGVMIAWDGTKNEVLVVRKGDDVIMLYNDGVQHTVSVGYFNQNGYITGKQIVN